MPRRKTPAARKTRLDCYERITESANLFIEDRARRHPEWVSDQRGLDGLEQFYHWLGERVFVILNDYCIEDPVEMAARDVEFANLQDECRRLRAAAEALRQENELLDQSSAEEQGEDP